MSSRDCAKHAYREDCPGCQIAISALDGPLPDDHPYMKAALAIWWSMSFEERAACNRVFVHNSRAAADLRVVQRLQTQLQHPKRPASA